MWYLLRSTGTIYVSHYEYPVLCALNQSLLYVVPCCVGIRGQTADKYADQQRAEMLSHIVNLELAMTEKENTITSLCKEFEEKQEQYEERINGRPSIL